jgi:E-phenylitaconyl-CoA hydratase
VSTNVLLSARDGAVGTLTLNRPERRNAIDQAMRDSLRSSLEELDADRAIRVVVLTGAGESFCAGVDLAEAAGGGEVGGVRGATGDAAGRNADTASNAPSATARPPIAEPLWTFRKPVIAALNGAAVGGGLELALACDIRVASEGARFGLTELKIGSLPGSGGTQLLPRIVGPGNAARLILTGDLIDAAEALRIGLVSDVVAPEALAAEAAALARRIAQNAPLSLLAAKEALRAAAELGFAEGRKLERRLWAELAATEDRSEGRAAFRQKRPPRFTGR